MHADDIVDVGLGHWWCSALVVQPTDGCNSIRFREAGSPPRGLASRCHTEPNEE
jgi:hypothetical protein